MRHIYNLACDYFAMDPNDIWAKCSFYGLVGFVIADILIMSIC